jgi:hypothetical protein
VPSSHRWSSRSAAAEAAIARWLRRFFVPDFFSSKEALTLGLTGLTRFLVLVAFFVFGGTNSFFFVFVDGATPLSSSEDSVSASEASSSARW